MSLVKKLTLVQFSYLLTSFIYILTISQCIINIIRETGLLKIMADILWNMEVQQVTTMACIDLSDVFNTVDHAVPVDILCVNFGLPTVSALVMLESHTDKRQLISSVPQGSCLGPSLYSFCASTMSETVP